MLNYILLNGELNISVKLSEKQTTADIDEILALSYVPQQIEAELPPQTDSEVTRLFPSLFSIFAVQLYKSNSTKYYLSDFGFTNSDVKLFSNRLKKSFIRLSYYDTDDKLSRTPYYEIDLFISKTIFYDTNNHLLDVENIPLIFNIKNPKVYSDQTEGFYIYLKNKDLDVLSKLFLNFRFNSALDGNSYVFYPEQGLSADSVQSDSEYIEVTISTPSYDYLPQKTLTYNTQSLNIKLYAI